MEKALRDFVEATERIREIAVFDPRKIVNDHREAFDAFSDFAYRLDAVPGLLPLLLILAALGVAYQFWRLATD